jgi:hypothetical protein
MAISVCGGITPGGIGLMVERLTESVNTLRRWIILGASWGVGCGLTLATVYGIWMWHKTRPINWNRAAIVATFDNVKAVLGEDRLVFGYTLHNRTAADYRLLSADQVELMARLKDPQVVVRADLAKTQVSYDHPTTLEHLPVFIPAGESVQFSVSWFSPYPDDFTKPVGSAAIALRSGAGMIEAMPLEKVTGFILFDRVTRYRIDLPKGW